MKHVHILGIGGVFMGSLALIARQLGYKVTGVDVNLYPPMSDILSENNISYIETDHTLESFSGEQKNLLDKADYVVIGNVIKRSNPAIDYILDKEIKFYSGANWLHEFVLRNQWVVAVTGTHGKTTTTSILAWILDYAGLEPGFLIGGAHGNFGVSGRLGAGKFFVIEADEYDTSLFDKRPKFLHYFPDTLIINNIEYDHADIYENIDEIKKQFTYLLRTISSSHGKIIFNADDANVKDVLSGAGYLNTLGFSSKQEKNKNLYNYKIESNKKFILDSLKTIEGTSPLLGEHNISNVVAAVSAAEHAGVPMDIAIESLKSFKGVSRRLEFKGKVNGVVVYDDFAHHPTAISKTLDAIKKEHPENRLVAVVDFCSYTMRNGIHKELIADSLKLADVALLYQGEYVNWSIQDHIISKKKNHNQEVTVCNSLDSLYKALKDLDDANCTMLFMSNGKFTKIIPTVIENLKLKYAK